MTTNHTRRDRSTARILGVFLAVLSIPVLIGGFSAAQTIDLALGTAAGAALLLAEDRAGRGGPSA